MYIKFHSLALRNELHTGAYYKSYSVSRLNYKCLK